MKKDIISKSLIKELIAKNISKYILGFNVKNYQFIDKEFERIESRRADIVLKIENEYIIHIEVQSSYEAKMPYRMLRYFLDIKELFDLPVKQYLINLSNVNIKNSLEEFNYSYEVVNIKNLNCEEFLNSNSPDAVVLAILCDFKHLRPDEIIEKILRKLKKIIKDDKTFRKYFDSMGANIVDNFNYNRLFHNQKYINSCKKNNR